MNNFKVINLLKSLDKEEIKSFKKFLKSPYFKRGRDLSKYFNFLIKYYPDFKIESKEIVYKYFKSNDDKNFKIINTLNSELNKSLEDFLAVEFIFHNDFYYTYSLVSKLSHIGLNENIEKQYDSYIKKSKGMYEDQNVYYQFYMMDTILASSLAMQGKYDKILELMISQSENISKLFIVLSNYFLNSFKVRDLEQKYPENILLLNLIVKNLDFDNLLKIYKNYEGDKKIKMNLYIMAMFSEAKDKDKFIVPLINTYKEIYDELNKGDRIVFYTLIHNFLTGKTRDKYINEMFDLIKFITEKKTLISTGFQHFNIQNFKISILISLRVKEIEWAKNFTKEYVNYLHESEKQVAENFARAFLLNAEGHYENSNEEILKIRTDNEFMNYDLRTLQLKNYYELAFDKPEYIENLYHGINALKNFLITNKKVSKRIIESGIDFKKGIQILFKYVTGDDIQKEELKFNLKKLKGQVRNYWIKEKIDGILNLK